MRNNETTNNTEFKVILMDNLKGDKKSRTR